MAADMKSIKLRIKSVQGTMQITKAMELVASSKLRKAKERADNCKPYFEVLHSTLQDIDAGRHTEIDMFSGALMRMGKELGIPTPYNEYTYHMIKALEEKNDGLFDYSGKDQEPTWAK